MSRGRVSEKDDNYIQTQCIHVLRLRGILSVITAGCPMVGTTINLVRGLTRLGLIEDLNLAITVRKPLEWLKKGQYRQYGQYGQSTDSNGQIRVFN